MAKKSLIELNARDFQKKNKKKKRKRKKKKKNQRRAREVSGKVPAGTIQSVDAPIFVLCFVFFPTTRSVYSIFTASLAAFLLLDNAAWGGAGVDFVVAISCGVLLYSPPYSFFFLFFFFFFFFFFSFFFLPSSRTAVLWLVTLVNRLWLITSSVETKKKRLNGSIAFVLFCFFRFQSAFPVFWSVLFRLIGFP